MTNAVAQTARQVRYISEELLSAISSGDCSPFNETLNDRVEVLARELAVLATAVAVLADAVDGADQ